MIKIDFEFETEYGVFRDALHVNEDLAQDTQKIESMKQDRLNKWLKFAKNEFAHESSVINVPAAPEESAAPEAPDTIEIDGVLYVKA